VNPNLAVSVLRDYIDCIHIGGDKRVQGPPDRFGCVTWTYAACPMEQSQLNIPAWIAALRQAKVTAPLIIEDYEPGLAGAQRLTRSAQLLQRILQDGN
jgi:hypothetical protein